MQTLSTNIQYIDVGPRVGLDVTGNRKTGRRKVGGWGMEFLIGVCMSVPRLRFPLSNPRAIAPGRCGKKKKKKSKLQHGTEKRELSAPWSPLRLSSVDCPRRPQNFLGGSSVNYLHGLCQLWTTVARAIDKRSLLFPYNPRRSPPGLPTGSQVPILPHVPHLTGLTSPVDTTASALHPPSFP